MQFKKDNNLACVISERRVLQNVDYARMFYLYCIESGLFQDRIENHGKTVGALIAKKNVFEVCQTLAFYLGKRVIPSDVFDAFCNLTIE